MAPLQNSFFRHSGHDPESRKYLPILDSGFRRNDNDTGLTEACNGFKILKNNQAGAVILAIVVTMTIVAVLGAAMLNLSTSSSFSEVFINKREKAYYLAQAGRQYATMIINAANIAGDPAPIIALNGQTFTLADGSKFYLRTNNTDVERTYVESTGIVNQGTVLETKQKIIFTVESIKFSQDVFAVTSIQVSARAIVDSYDSRNGPYSLATRTEEANVQTNGITSGAITIIGEVHGNAICGKDGNPLTAISVYGVLTGTKTAASNNVIFSAVIPPPPCTAFATCGNLIAEITTPTTLNESNCTLLPCSTPPCKYACRTNKIDLSNETLTINGNIVLIVYGATGTLNMIRASSIIISPGGSLELYIKTQADFAGTSIINPPPSAATNVTVLGITTAQLNFSGTSATYGGVYAPGATFSLASESQLYGTVVANTIAMSGAKSGSGIHIDKAFSAAGGGTGAGNIVY